MTDTLKRIVGPVATQNTTWTLFDPGEASSVIYTLKEIRVVAVTALSFRLALQSAPGAIANSEVIIPAISIPAGGIFVHPCFIVLLGDENLRVASDQTDGAVTISGLKQS